MALWVREGPYAMPQSRFDPGQMLEMVRNRKLRLANLGYLGHMWELYSMWGWIAVIFAASAGWSRSKYEAYAALAIGIGAVGCIWAGAASDRLQDQSAEERVSQRAWVTIIAMVDQFNLLSGSGTGVSPPNVAGRSFVDLGHCRDRRFGSVLHHHQRSFRQELRWHRAHLPGRTRLSADGLCHPRHGRHCRPCGMAVGDGQHGRWSDAWDMGDGGAGGEEASFLKRASLLHFNASFAERVLFLS